MVLNQNQRNELRNHFRDHSYFRLCSAVHAVFQQYDSRIVLSREQLFVDAATTLDRLLTDDRKETLCHDLWSDLQDEYRTLEGNKTGQETTQVEVAMLCYAVMFGLTYVYDNRSFYRQRLGQTIHNRVHCMWRHCEAVESALPAAVNAYSEGMRAWMQDYFRSADSLTEEIGNIVKGDTKKAKGGGASGRKEKRKETSLPPTFPYKYHGGEEGIRRIDAVMKVLQHKKWIEPPAKADDFHNLFSGRKRACNIQWTGALSALYALTKRLLEQDYMEKKSGVSVNAIVTKQFGKGRDNHEPTDDNQQVINLIVKILDVTQPWSSSRAEEDDDEDDFRYP